ncbi:hypothetical protein [Clostridium ljungdahlii]|uniref:Uncharacterized protein n=1 Tax=Clostridium ljungdahlii TaxID=1538 RepID=A0A168MHF9_9CLOT|nr:hypothetical protein [Clostridium ljungdahlii]OAA84695.1 hypothetical protein WY13_02594 [Clostridium ljungdahlii]
MSYSEDICFLGNWNLNDEQGTLNIEKTGETYKCTWKINKEDVQKEYLGIGMLVDNQLLISRFSNKVHGGGVGLYRPIGDLRSNSALWASTQNFNTLGSGIALREDTSQNLEGNYKVRYFIKGNESPTYDLRIVKNEKNNVYSLNWSVNDKIILHGIGMMNKGQMPLAYGGTNFDYELFILSIDNKNRLSSKCALLSNSCITEEVYRKC